MKVMISGSSGLIGSELKKSLERDGHSTVSLSRSYEEPIDFSGVDAVVHLAGEPIAEGRWTEEKKQRIRASRVDGTAQLAGQVASSTNKPRVFICASAIGYYGDRSSEVLDETSKPGNGFLPDVCKQWEDAAQPARDAGVRTVHIRTGIVLSEQGGALRKMLTPFKLGGGGVLGSGTQYMSWISLADEIAIIRYLIDHSEAMGAFNLVAPNPVTNKEFTKTLGHLLKRPTLIPMPAFAVRLLFGEMGDALLLASERVVPKKIIDSGYQFIHPTLELALRSILK